MYSVTTTRAIVLKSHDLGEKDLFLSLFTKDLGQIYVRVSGVRDLKSKHRYAVQEHSLIDVSIVKGKMGWRITNTSFVKSYYFETPDSFKRETILKILSLVRRFYLGEESNQKVFDDLSDGFENINNASNREEVENFEAQTVLSFLFDLGYVEEMVVSDDTNKLRKIINNSIKSSGL